jgi:hypothetical protein
LVLEKANKREPDQWELTPQGWRNVADRRRNRGYKNIVVTLVERGGKARSVQAEDLTLHTLNRIVTENADKASSLMTDEATAYRRIGRQFASHETVNHGEEEYVRGRAHVNTAENYFSIFKRGMIGVYQHCNEQHLHRYAAEFDFRYSNRAALGIDDVKRTGTPSGVSSASGSPIERLVEKRPKPKAPRPRWVDGPYRKPVQLWLPFDGGNQDQDDAKGGK